jgi:hypothetical protein
VKCVLQTFTNIYHRLVYCWGHCFYIQQRSHLVYFIDEFRPIIADQSRDRDRERANWMCVLCFERERMNDYNIETYLYFYFTVLGGGGRD